MTLSREWPLRYRGRATPWDLLASVFPDDGRNAWPRETGKDHGLRLEAGAVADSFS